MKITEELTNYHGELATFEGLSKVASLMVKKNLVLGVVNEGVNPEYSLWDANDPEVEELAFDTLYRAERVGNLVDLIPC